MNPPWDAIAVTGMAVAAAALPVIRWTGRLWDACRRRLDEFRARRRARAEADRFLRGIDLDMALKQLFLKEGCYRGDPDDAIWLLADEVFRGGDQ